MEIEDNFLEQNIFDELQTLMIGEYFPWHYYDEGEFKYTNYFIF